MPVANLQGQELAQKLRTVAPWDLGLTLTAPVEQKAPSKELESLARKLGIFNAPGYRIEKLQDGLYRGYGALAIPMLQDGVPVVLRTPAASGDNPCHIRETCALDLAELLRKKWDPAQATLGRNIFPCRIIGDHFIEGLVKLAIINGFIGPSWEARSRNEVVQAFLFVGGRNASSSHEIPIRSHRATNMLAFNWLFDPLNVAAMHLLHQLACGNDVQLTNGKQPLEFLTDGKIYLHRTHDGTPDYLHTLLALRDFGLKVREKVNRTPDGVRSERLLLTPDDHLIESADAIHRERIFASLQSARVLVEKLSWIGDAPVDQYKARSPHQFVELYRNPKPSLWWPARYTFRPGLDIPVTMTYQLGDIPDSYVDLVHHSPKNSKLVTTRVEPVESELKYASVPRIPLVFDGAPQSTGTPVSSITIPSTTPRRSIDNSDLSHGDTVYLSSLPTCVQRLFTLISTPQSIGFIRQTSMLPSGKDRRERTESSNEWLALTGGAVPDAMGGQVPNDLDVNGIAHIDPFVAMHEGYAHTTSAIPSRHRPLPLVSEVSPDLSARNARLRAWGLAALRRELERSRSDDRFLIGRLSVGEFVFRVEQAGFDIITPKHEVLRQVPTLSVLGMVITNSLRFLDRWNGAEDLRKSVARIVGPLENLSLRTLIGLIRRQTVRQLRFDDQSLEIIANARDRLLFTLSAFADYGLPESSKFAHQQIQKELQKFRSRVGEQVMGTELQRHGLLDPLHELQTLYATFDQPRS